VERRREIELLQRRIEMARTPYKQSEPAMGTAVEIYLCRLRGITPPIPEALRYLRQCPHRRGGYFPAMLAPIVNVAGEQIALHKTFLKPDGSGKADLPKAE